MTTEWIERHLYDAGGHTGNTYYIRIINRGSSEIWDPEDAILKAVGDITWEESADVLTEEGDTGVFPIVIQHDWRTVEDIAGELYEKRLCDLTDVEKAAVGVEHQSISNLPAGTYDIVVYEQDGSAPANSDAVVKQYETKLGGGNFGF